MKLQIADYLYLYAGCAIADSADNNFIVADKMDANFIEYLIKSERLTYFKLVLRPLSSMTDEEVLKLCKLASVQIYGDYRFSKWEAKKSHHDICHWDVINPKSPWMFCVHSADGDVSIYSADRGEKDDTWIDLNYRFWYPINQFDTFGLIEAGLAIDKTTLITKIS